MRQWLRRHVFANAGLKLIAFVLAVILYGHVFTSQENELVLDLPLALRGVPEGLTWSGDLDEEARVRFRGLGVDLLKLRARLERARVQVDVSEARPGHYQRPIVTDDVVLPPDLRVQPLEVVAPREIFLEFDRLLLERLPVVPRVTGRVAAGYTVHGRTVLEPDSVVVRGAAALLRGLEQVATETIDLTGASDVVTRRVGLALREGLRAVPPEVTVRVTIEEVVSRTFTELPVEVLRSRGVELRELEPRTGMVVVSGPASVVESLTAGELSASIDARGLPPGGTYTLMASVELRRAAAAGAVSIEPVKPEKFEVTLE